MPQCKRLWSRVIDFGFQLEPTLTTEYLCFSLLPARATAEDSVVPQASANTSNFSFVESLK